MSDFQIHVVPALKDNYIFILEHLSSKDCVIVDPTIAEPVKQFVQKHGLNPRIIWNTHHHWDHVGGNAELKEAFNLEIFGFDEDQKRIPGIDHLVNENEIITWKDLEIKVFFAPGHTSGHLLYHVRNLNVLFSGDVLFGAGCGRLFEGTYEQMFHSLQKIKSLPDETLVYAAHEYTLANIKFAKTIAPSDALATYELKAEVKRGQTLPTVPLNLGVEKTVNPFLVAKIELEFKSLRLKKDNF